MKRENFEREDDQFKKLDLSPLSEKTAKIWKNRSPVHHEYLPYLEFNDVCLKKYYYFIYQVTIFKIKLISYNWPITAYFMITLLKFSLKFSQKENSIWSN